MASSGHAHRRFVAYWLAATACLLGWFTRLRADGVDSFETPEPSWKLVDRDCESFRVRVHERQFYQPHSGQACEHLEIQADFGTYVHYGLPLEPSPVIDELSISLWVKSGRPGIQLLASVVLPHARNPKDGSPLRTSLRGTVYQDVGQWQQLTLTGCAKLLRQQLPSLRYEFGPHVDTTEAYVDLVALNVFGGRGVTELWIDDLEIRGQVPGRVPATGLAARIGQSSVAPIGIQGTLLVSRDRPVFLRMVEYNGEPFAWLQSIGFNAIRLAEYPDSRQLEEAESLGLWLIAPQATSGADRIASASLIAEEMRNGSSLATVSSTMPGDKSLKGDGAQRRLLRTAVIGLAERGRHPGLDFPLVELPTIGSGWELTELGDAFRRYDGSREGAGPWVAVLPSEPPGELWEQWRGVGWEEADTAWLEPEQLELLAMHAAGAGARGVLFRSRHRLDTNDLSTRLRRRALELVNLELQFAEPFLTGGRSVGRLDVGNSRLLGYGIETDHAELLIVCRRAPEQQFAVPAYVEQTVTITVPTVSTSSQAYQLTGGGLRQLSCTRVAGGLRIQVEHMRQSALIVMTQENLVMNRLAESALQTRQRRVEARIDLASIAFEAMEAIRGTRPATDVEHLRRVGDAAGRLEQSTRLLVSRDYRAAEMVANQALNAIAAVRRDWWEESVRAFRSASASPCCALFSSLPAHWTLMERVQGKNWSGNVLPGGAMEDLARLIDTGWQRETTTANSITTHVELSFEQPHSGRSSLHLVATPHSTSLGAPRPSEPPIVIHSSPIPLRSGQLLQIRGFARVPRGTGEPAALHIYDSLAGPLLGTRLTARDEWCEWVLYRTSASDQPLILHFELMGFGEAWIDDVTIQRLDLAPEGMESATSRLPAMPRLPYDRIRSSGFHAARRAAF